MCGFTNPALRRLAACALASASLLTSTAATAVELARIEGFGPVARGMAGNGVAFPVGAGAMMLNPAELLTLDAGQELLLQLTEIHPEIPVIQGATRERRDAADLGNNRGPYDLPELAYARRLGNWAFGAGVFAAGGFGGEYGKDSFLSRTISYEVDTGLRASTRLNHLRIPLALAWRPHQRLRVGASIDIVNASLNLASLLDVQQIGMLIADGRVSGTLLPVLGSVPDLAGAHFDFVRNNMVSSELSAWGVGGRIGFSLDLGTRTTVAASYEFQTRLGALKGDGTLTAIDRNNQQIPLPGAGRLPVFEFPQAFVVGIAQRLTPRLAITADLRRTFWAQTMANTEVHFRSADGATLQVLLPTGFNNLTTLGLGTQWQFASQWTLRAGGTHAFQPTVPDDHLSGSFPTLTRNHVAAMLAYLSPARRHEFDAGISYGFTPTQRNPGNNINSIAPIEAYNRLITPVLGYRYRF